MFFYFASSNISNTFQPLDLIKRRSIHKVLYSSSLRQLYVVAGREGIDAYKLNSLTRKIEHIYTISLNSTSRNGSQPLNLINANLNGNRTEIFILDDREGIHFVKLIRDNYVMRKIELYISKEVSDFFIRIENPISFAYLKSSFIVVAQTKQKINYAVEILMNL